MVNDLLLHFDYSSRYEANKLHFGTTEHDGALPEKRQEDPFEQIVKLAGNTPIVNRNDSHR